jgi:hypothetical protein
VLDAVKSNKPNPFGAARPREDILAEKGLDWKKVDMELEGKKTSRPNSSHSSRPGSSHSIRSDSSSALQGLEGAVRPRPKVNPFGDAKPREVLLQEKGLDWKKIDMELDHRSVERAETEAEKNMKEEIEQLKKELERESAGEDPGKEQSSLSEIVADKEKELEILARDLDDKVRFGQKAIERPGSGSGRPQLHSASGEDSRNFERPPSRGDSRNFERPPSRGDSWGRHQPQQQQQQQQGDDRRGFGGGRVDNRGFLGNRDNNLDRPRLRDRW